MVSHTSRNWNTLWPSLEKLNARLEELGLVEVNSEIVYLYAEEDEHV